MNLVLTILQSIAISICLTGCQSMPLDTHDPKIAVSQITISPSEQALVATARNEWNNERQARIRAALDNPPPDVDPDQLAQVIAEKLEEIAHAGRSIETELSDWQPPAYIQPRALGAAAFDLNGEWHKSSHYDGSSLQIRSVSDDLFAVRFSTWGCIGSWELDRAARIRNGMLVLDRPVKEYLNGPSYNVLFVTKDGGEEILVPFRPAKKFADAGGNADDQGYPWNRFNRSEPD